MKNIDTLDLDTVTGGFATNSTPDTAVNSYSTCLNSAISKFNKSVKDNEFNADWSWNRTNRNAYQNFSTQMKIDVAACGITNPTGFSDI